ncbi:MAG: hypothetical protein KAW90_05580 [Dehalococcoidales bacterium]|nr:hypothetical protein [Dehalococcoidales bacterium]
MKKVIKKYWGIGLIIVLVSSLFVAAAPVSAGDPLKWEGHFDGPSGGVYGLVPGSDILDYAIGNDGTTYYAVTGTNAYMTTSGGAMWTKITDRIPGFRTPQITAEDIDLDTIDLVAMAPDDPSIAVVVDASANSTNYIGGAITSNGGASFSALGTIGAKDAGMLITGVEISPMVTGGFRYIALYGRSAGSDSPVVYYYNFGAAVGSWGEAAAGAGWTGPTAVATIDNIAALAFSPNFPSDYMAVVLSEETGTSSVYGALRMHILSFNSMDWDVPVASGYPVTISDTSTTANASAAGVFVVASGSLALLPDYDGADESLRIAFAGATINPTTAEGGGVWRTFDYINSGKVFGATQSVAINSVAFDGTNLAAGAYLDNNVYRSADPLATAPTFLGSRGLKEIGIDDTGANDQIQLQFAGEVLYGAKQGAASALSKSLDYGHTWNDFTLIDSGLGGYPYIGAGTITDTYYTASGDPWYVAAQDGGETSVYRVSMFATTRVLCIDGTLDLKLRGAPDDADVIYAAQKAGTVIYYTADGGLGRWYKRTAPAAIDDIAVESQGVIYIGSGVKVFKSVTSGFTWGIPVDSRVTVSIYSLLSLGENQLLVGGSAGGVTYTTDGAASFTKTFGAGGTTNLLVTATGLAPGDSIFAADAGSNAVYRQVIGTDIFFLTMNVPAAVTGTIPTNTGLLLTNGVLYALTSDSGNVTRAASCHINRTLAPTIPVTHPALFWGTRFSSTQTMAVAPSALKAHAGMGGSIVLEAVDTAGMGFLPYDMPLYFDDNVALAGPALIGPTNGTRVNIASPLTGVPANVNFTWERMSLATGYYLFIALDDGFTEMIGPPLPVGTVALPNAYSTVSSIQPGSSFLPGTTYYWRVATYLPLSSSFSETRSFVVQPTAASVPTIASPENGGTIDSLSPAFSWTPAAGATMYQFQLSATPDFATTLVDEQLASAGIAPAVALDRGTTYFWRVKALQPVEGDWSTVANFMVAMAAPAPTPPVVIETVPPPVIEIPPAPPATVVEIPPAPPVEKIAPAYIWAIIIIGAVLVIAVVVLIVRTRRQV